MRARTTSGRVVRPDRLGPIGGPEIVRMPVVANAPLFDEESDLAGGAGVNHHLMVGRSVRRGGWQRG